MNTLDFSLDLFLKIKDAKIPAELQQSVVDIVFWALEQDLREDVPHPSTTASRTVDWNRLNGPHGHDELVTMAADLDAEEQFLRATENGVTNATSPEEPR